MDPHYHDLAKLTRTDPEFREKMESLAVEMAQEGTTRDDSKRQTALMKIMRAAFYNMGFLLPWFFPRFGGVDDKGREVPMSLGQRPFAFPIFAFLLGGFLVLKGSRQIGKSASLSARNLMATHLLPRWTSIYMAPHGDHVKTFATKMQEMQSLFRYGAYNKGFRNNLYLKEFPNLSRIEMHRVLTSAAHMRGKVADELDYDEYQLFDIRLEAETNQLQRVTKTPVTIYAGTSTTVDSPLEIRYQQSSGGVWMMRSPDSKRFIDCSDPDIVLKMIREKGLTCPYTDRLILNPLNGEFAHARPELAAKNILGIHIPQFIIPDFMTPVEWRKIWDYRCQFGDSRTLQEVGGISVAEGEREMTEQNLKDMCCLPFDHMEHIQKERTGANNKYRLIVSGMDWGGSDYQMARTAKTSYTVHVVLGILSDGTFDVLLMKRYSGMKYDEIAENIIRDHLRLGGTAMASDYGVGHAYNTYLHRDKRINPLRHFVFEYSTPYSQMIKKPAYQFIPTHYMLNKTESITQLYGAIKKLRIRCYSYENAYTKAMLEDFLNSFRVPSESRMGRQYSLWIRNPAKADDTLHAFNFAFMLGRMLLKEPVFDDPSLANYIYGQLAGMSAHPPGGSMLGDFRGMVGMG